MIQLFLITKRIHKLTCYAIYFTAKFSCIEAMQLGKMNRLPECYEHAGTQAVVHLPPSIGGEDDATQDLCVSMMMMMMMMDQEPRTRVAAALMC